MLGGHGQQVLATRESLLRFDFGAEARFAGASVTLEHADTQVAVLEGPGDRTARPSGDVPGEGAAELAGGELPGCPVDVRHGIVATVVGAVALDPGQQITQQVIGVFDPRRPLCAIFPAREGQQQVDLRAVQVLEGVDRAGGEPADHPDRRHTTGFVLTLERKAGDRPPVSLATGVAMGAQAAAPQVLDYWWRALIPTVRYSPPETRNLAGAVTAVVDARRSLDRPVNASSCAVGTYPARTCSAADEWTVSGFGGLGTRRHAHESAPHSTGRGAARFAALPVDGGPLVGRTTFARAVRERARPRETRVESRRPGRRCDRPPPEPVSLPTTESARAPQPARSAASGLA